MAEPAEIRAQKRRSDRAAIYGVLVMLVSVLLSSYQLAPRQLTTAGALVGFGLLMYAVHVGWMVFYDRESDGPPS